MSCHVALPVWSDKRSVFVLLLCSVLKERSSPSLALLSGWPQRCWETNPTMRRWGYQVISKGILHYHIIFGLSAFICLFSMSLFSGRCILLWNNPVWDHCEGPGRPGLPSTHRGGCSPHLTSLSPCNIIIHLRVQCVCFVHRLISLHLIILTLFTLQHMHMTHAEAEGGVSKCLFNPCWQIFKRNS